MPSRGHVDGGRSHPGQGAVRCRHAGQPLDDPPRGARPALPDQMAAGPGDRRRIRRTVVRRPFGTSRAFKISVFGLGALSSPGAGAEALMRYELYYWPEIQGRGEFVRLALEEAGAAYVDVARRRGYGAGAMMKTMESGARPPFAPPFLKAGKLVIAQVALILQHLGPKLRLV